MAACSAGFRLLYFSYTSAVPSASWARGATAACRSPRAPTGFPAGDASRRKSLHTHRRLLKRRARGLQESRAQLLAGDVFPSRKLRTPRSRSSPGVSARACSRPRAPPRVATARDGRPSFGSVFGRMEDVRRRMARRRARVARRASVGGLEPRPRDPRRVERTRNRRRLGKSRGVPSLDPAAPGTREASPRAVRERPPRRVVALGGVPGARRVRDVIQPLVVVGLLAFQSSPAKTTLFVARDIPGGGASARARARGSERRVEPTRRCIVPETRPTFVYVESFSSLDSTRRSLATVPPPPQSAPHAHDPNRVPRVLVETTSAVVARREPIATIAPTE